MQAQLREPNVSVVGDAAVDTKGDIIADVQFEVLYLGEEAAVLQLVPADDEDDEEAAEQPLFVLRNTGAQSLPSAEVCTWLGVNRWPAWLSSCQRLPTGLGNSIV